MNVTIGWYESTLEELTSLWVGFIGFIPQLLGAFIVFSIGLLIAAGIGKLVAVILEKLRVNQIFEREAWKQAMEKAEINVDASGFIGGIIKWVLVIFFLMLSVEILGWEKFAEILEGVLAYLPNVVVAALIFVVAALISDLVGKVVRTTVEGAKMGSGHMAELIVRWSVWVFAIVLILAQLEIGKDVPADTMKVIVQGIVAFFAIAGGLAFGLGGKEVAQEMLHDVRQKMKR